MFTLLLYAALIRIDLYILLVAKPKCIWNWYANNKTIQILFMLNSHYYSERQNDKVLAFYIIHFSNPEISASL